VQCKAAAARRQARRHPRRTSGSATSHRAIERRSGLIEVVNTLFGGRFTSMINTELRIKSGLTYGASSGFAQWKTKGPFFVNSYTSNREHREGPRHDARRAQAPARKGHFGGGSQSAKAYLKGQFPPDIETSDQLAGVLVGARLQRPRRARDQYVLRKDRRRHDGRYVSRVSQAVLSAGQPGVRPHRKVPPKSRRWRRSTRRSWTRKSISAAGF